MVRLEHGVGLLSVAAKAALSSASLPSRASVAPTINATAVLDVPPTVEAGTGTLVHFNFSNSNRAEDGFQFLEIFASAWPRDVDPDDSESTDPSYYCLLEQCVATNITTLSLNIPADILPDIRMKVNYNIFGSSKVSYNAWGDQSTTFNLTGGEGVLTDWEHRYGFDAISHWVTRLPCSSVPCARKCIQKYLDVDAEYYEQEDKSAFKSCVQSCPGIHTMGDYDSRTCIVTNATRDSTESDSDATTTASVAASSATDASKTSSTAAAESSTPSSQTTSNSSAGRYMANLGLTGLAFAAMYML